MRELMKFRGQEASSLTSITSSFNRRVRTSSSNSVTTTISSRQSFRPSSAIGTEIGLRTNESPGTTKVEVLSDGLKWLVIYSLLPSSSAGAAMSGGLGSGLEVVSNTGGLGSLGSKVIEAYYAVNSGMNAIALGSLNQAAMIGAVAGVVNQIVKEQQVKVFASSQITPTPSHGMKWIYFSALDSPQY